MFQKLCIYKQRKNIKDIHVKSVLHVVKKVTATSFTNDKNDPKYSFLCQLLMFMQFDFAQILQ